MKEQTKKAGTQATEISEVEKLRAQIKKLESLLGQQPQSLEEKIRFFQEKQEMIKQLAILDGYANGLLKIAEDIQKDHGDEDFMTERYFLRITHKPNTYGSEQEIMKIHNPKIIAEVLGYSIGKINEKRTHLQNLINA